MRLLTFLLLASSMVFSAGCASNGDGSKGAEEPAAQHRIARELAYTHLLEVRVGNDVAVTAYLVEFDELPLGVIDERPYPVGTALVQDVEMYTLGFLTPGGQAFRFDDKGASHELGHGSRHELVARVLNTSQIVRLRAVGASR